MTDYLTPLIPVVIGALLAFVAGLIGAAVQSQREHSKWLRDKRLEGFEQAWRLTMKLRQLVDQWEEMQQVETANAERLEQHKKEVLALAEKAHESSSRFMVLGPETAAAGLRQILDGETAEDRYNGQSDAITAIRKALGIKE